MGYSQNRMVTTFKQFEVLAAVILRFSLTIFGEMLGNLFSPFVDDARASVRVIWPDWLPIKQVKRNPTTHLLIHFQIPACYGHQTTRSRDVSHRSDQVTDI
jgi:hypothetical protein